jgi:Transcriptional regulators
LCDAPCRCSQGAASRGGDAKQRCKEAARAEGVIEHGIQALSHRRPNRLPAAPRPPARKLDLQVGIGDPNITPTQYSSLAKLNEYTELSQNLLGRLVGMDKATMQGVVRRLKERGLVDSRPDPGDARRTLLSLTTEGLKLVNKLLVNGPAVSRETLKPLNAQEQKQLLDLLSRII